MQTQQTYISEKIRNSSNTLINPATEEKQDAIISALGGASTYDLRIDDTTTANVMYIGEATIGTATSSASWRIKKLNETSGITVGWADSNANFDNVWDNRASLTYSI